MAGTTAEHEPVGPPTGSSGLGPESPAAAPSAAATQHQRAAGQLWLIRHGETEWSKARLHTGRTDVPLTEVGEAQARGLRPMLRGLRPALVLVSPRQRARRTAELAGLAELAPLETCADLAEWEYGEYEGRTTPQIRAERPGWTIWSGDPPGGETAAQVGARADAVLARVRPALASGDVVVVAHGHFGRVLAARWLGLEPTGGRLFALEPAAPCVLDVEHDLPVVFRWNLPSPAG
ncbi:MAG TPA: histidine phosphatase family protein [Mycobacteriales bacterium]|nr:histidine phosphatase family protein [Mycobacteriales bacterium]